MSWIALSLLSAIVLGFYDVVKKLSVSKNAVPAVLLANVAVGAAICLPWIILSAVAPQWVPTDLLRVDSMPLVDHAFIFAKAALVGMSWTFAFFSLKHLPLSIAAPIRATSPLWTIMIAIPFLGERPTALQWLAMAITLIGFWMFSVVGRREGIRFTRDRWVTCMVVATVLGALSGIYDKILLQTLQMRPANVQAWFAVYLVVVMFPLFAYWYVRQRPTTPFHWRWAILLVSPLLLAADMMYFIALSDPEALIAVISTIRRCSVVIAFAVGIRWFGEVNFRPKAVCVAAILLGVLLLTLGKA